MMNGQLLLQLVINGVIIGVLYVFWELYITSRHSSSS